MIRYVDIFDKLIFSKKKALNKEFCRHVIDKFEKDDRKYQGTTAEGVDLDMKISTDLLISPIEDWGEEDQVFYDSLRESIEEYKEMLDQINSELFHHVFHGELSDSGYQIQRTEIGGFYKWHHDYCIEPAGNRILTYLWYLNEVEEGGCTEFVNGKMIKPKTGKLILFPSTWTYFHQGNPPISNVKYLCTGWLYSKDNFFMELFSKR
jgi:Rps23 Pro-64 3,4-dihydroxylase Tpa1-like proline 4-hydroxylase